MAQLERGNERLGDLDFGDSDDSERVDVLDPKVSPLKLTVPLNLNLRIHVMGILFADSYPISDEFTICFCDRIYLCFPVCFCVKKDFGMQLELVIIDD